MNAMNDRQRATYERMTPEQRSAVDRIRARHATAEAREAERRVRDLVEEEIPPAIPRAVARLAAMIRAEREAQGLSIAELAEKAEIDGEALSRLEAGKITNPTFQTVERLTTAVGREILVTFVPA